MQRSTGGRNKRSIHLGNWTINDQWKDQDSEGKTQFTTFTPTLRNI